MSKSDIQNKLAAARTRLILDKPFLGALVLRLPLVAADPTWCKGATTDAKKLYYNQDYIDALDIQQTQFVLAKQALHCALSHFARRQHRIKDRWDVACGSCAVQEDREHPWCPGRGQLGWIRSAGLP